MNPDFLQIKYSVKLFAPHRGCLLIENINFGLHVFIEVAVTAMNGTGNPT